MLVNVGVAAIIIAAKITGSGFAAEIAVDTLVIDIVLARKVFGIAVSDVSHNLRDIKHIPLNMRCNSFSVFFVRVGPF